MIRVLLVDDHQLVRAGLEQLLGAADGIEVVGAASNGEGAVDLAVKTQPDVVLMDLVMPGVGGVEATRRILAAAPTAAIVVLTSFSDQERILDALDAGAVGYLLKDVEPAELLAGVRAAAKGDSPLDPKAARQLLLSRSGRPVAGLTPREVEVLALVRRGLANKQIARALNISERTVKAHLTSAFQRIGVTDRVQAALWAERHNVQAPAGVGRHLPPAVRNVTET
jgi:DNA-binding NarL/FixJ family response regulator